MDFLKKVFFHVGERVGYFARWIVISIIVAIITSFVGILFHYSMDFATNFRESHFWIIFFIPLAGMLIAFMYSKFDKEEKQNTNLVISSIHSNEEVPVKMLPLIFFSTIITHLFGGSAGREGAALQIGGSIGNFLGKLVRFNDMDRHVVIMSGMSAAFTTLFGTPLTATFFSMEVVSVGIMHYAALVPCAVAALVSRAIAVYFGARGEHFGYFEIPEINFINGLKMLFIAMLFAAVSVIFCIILHKTHSFFKEYIKNVYLRVITGGIIIIILTLIEGSGDYNGAGMNVIERAVNGESVSYAFILKMLFTAVTLGVGYKGGEIVPTLFVGATFGCVIGEVFNLSPSLCAATGMISVFCGVTNCPITSLLLGFELFGFEGMPYYLLAVAISYRLSGYYGLYQSQKIIYSKYKPKYVNKKVKK